MTSASLPHQVSSLAAMVPAVRGSGGITPDEPGPVVPLSGRERCDRGWTSPDPTAAEAEAKGADMASGPRRSSHGGQGRREAREDRLEHFWILSPLVTWTFASQDSHRRNEP